MLISDFLNDLGEIDIHRIKEPELGHLVKRLKVRRTYQGKGKDKLLTETVEVELHDAQAAAFKLASLMGLEVIKRELTPDRAAIEIELLEKERVVLTGCVQKLLDNGWTVKLALQHLKEMSIPEEKLRTSDIVEGLG